MPLVYTLVTILNSEFSLNLPIEIVGGLFGLFIAGETVIDTVAVVKNRNTEKKTEKTENASNTKTEKFLKIKAGQ